MIMNLSIPRNIFFINTLIIIKTLFYKIPPHLPFPKGGITPLWQRGAGGDFAVDVNSILRSLNICMPVFEPFIVTGWLKT